MPSRTASDIAPAQWKQYRPFSRQTGRRGAGEACNESLHVAARNVAACIATELKRRFGAQKVVLFGSFARTDFSLWSDIDIAVWGIPAQDYFRAVALASGISDRFKVDLVDADDCAASLKQRILDEGVEL